jgi:Fe-S-cluster-containing dehydrogenase component
MHLRADSSKCCGCRACQVACSLHRFGENNPKKSRLAIVPHFPDPGVYEVRTCTQCGACAEVCPVDAITKDAKGVYDIDPDICTGCLACVEVCPEGVMFTYPGMKTPFKCVRCGQCVAHCGMSVLRIE